MKTHTAPRLSLLDEPLIRVHGTDAEHMSLPQVLAELSKGEALDFLALRPHQQPAWHAFLVALAVLAMEAAQAVTPATDAQTWHTWLRGLTRSFPGDEPWCLLVSDVHLPAFLQPPVSTGNESDYSTQPKDWLHCAQELDRLVTAKNHDEKAGKVAGDDLANADAWLFALVSLQGFTGGLGRGNYGSARMNGAFGSRSQFRLVFAPGSGTEFLRDVSVLLAGLEQLHAEAIEMEIGHVDPLALTWLVPWDGQSLPLARMHPLALEVCRRVRLVCHGQGLAAQAAGSLGMRFDAKARRGVVLDPWTPTLFDDIGPKALTATADTLHYRHLTPLLFDTKRCRLPLLALPCAEEAARNSGAWLQACVLVGGGGKTDGWLQRSVWVPAIVLRRFASHDGAAALRAQQFIDSAGDMQGKVLRPACLQFVDASEQPNFKNLDAGRAVEPWVDHFQQAIDAVFYPALFASLQNHGLDAPALADWAIQLRDVARQVLNEATESLPTRDASRQFARARAQGLFQGALRKHFPAAATGTAAPAATDGTPSHQESVDA